MTSKIAAKSVRDHILNFDIDNFLDPFVPPSQLRRLPKPIAHFLGHRDHNPKEPSSLVSWALTYFATVAGLCTVGAVYNYAPGVTQWNPPPLIASLGASAVLDYNTIRSPLSQPRNTILGHTFSAIVAVAVSKGFQIYSDFGSINWVAAAVACATANLVMSITNTVHPPGGATAVLAAIQPQVIAMGWNYVPLILIASVLMCAVACLFNNTLRWYPTYWWTSAEVGQMYKSKAKRKGSESEESEGNDLEKQKTSHRSQGSDSERADSAQADDEAGRKNEIRLTETEIYLPPGFDLSHNEREYLGELQERLKFITDDA